MLRNNASVCPESVTELPSVPKAVSLFLLAWTLKRRRLCFVVLFLLENIRLKSRRATGKDFRRMPKKETNLLTFCTTSPATSGRSFETFARERRSRPLVFCDTAPRPRHQAEDATATGRGVYHRSCWGGKGTALCIPDRFGGAPAAAMGLSGAALDKRARPPLSPGPLAVLETPS